ncbi:unnamed protein product [Laminaria digitata]
MPGWKNVARVAVVLAVGGIAFASTPVRVTPRNTPNDTPRETPSDTWDPPSQTDRDLQELNSRTSDSDRGVCQYAVQNEEEALARGRDPSVPGTTVNVTNMIAGRLGNHFTIASRYLSLGYCCKAKLVTLPPKDPILAPGMFGEGTPGPRHFDFSDAPDVPGFNSSAHCAADYTKGGDDAYRAFLARRGLPYGYMDQKELALCIRSVRLLECEATYYFPKALDVCGLSDSDSGRLATPASVSASSNGETAGNLVMHVRSGDVFRMGKAYGSYGQPPLSYYMGVINNRDWDRVDLVTWGTEKRDENPVVPALQMLVDMGTWPNIDFNIHVDRSIEVDLQAMLCADAYATSRSTIGELTMYHTRAKTIFLPSTCDGYGSTFGHTSGRLIAARSSRDDSFEVQGVTLRPEAPLYTPYEKHEFTDNERLEMLQYSGLAGMEECTSSELDVDRWDSLSSSRTPLGNIPP